MTCDFAEKPRVGRDELRKRLQGMSNKELREFGKACDGMCSPEAKFNESPGEDFLNQLEEGGRNGSGESRDRKTRAEMNS
jgi:hypothetical protein